MRSHTTGRRRTAGKGVCLPAAGRLILLVVLIVGVADACGNFLGPFKFGTGSGPTLHDVSGTWNYATDTLVDTIAQLRCIVTTPMTLAQQTDGTIAGTYTGMSVSCRSPSGPVILHRDGKVVAGIFGGTELKSFYFDSAFDNLVVVSDGTRLSGSVSSSMSINGKAFGGTGGWTATKR